jgi:hypothetical protein
MQYAAFFQVMDPMAKRSGILSKLIGLSALAAVIAPPAVAAAPHYMNDEFRYTRILDWATRPD